MINLILNFVERGEGDVGGKKDLHNCADILCFVRVSLASANSVSANCQTGQRGNPGPGPKPVWIDQDFSQLSNSPDPKIREFFNRESFFFAKAPSRQSSSEPETEAKTIALGKLSKNILIFVRTEDIVERGDRRITSVKVTTKSRIGVGGGIIQPEKTWWDGSSCWVLYKLSKSLVRNHRAKWDKLYNDLRDKLSTVDAQYRVVKKRDTEFQKMRRSVSTTQGETIQLPEDCVNRPKSNSNPTDFGSMWAVLRDAFGKIETSAHTARTSINSVSIEVGIKMSGGHNQLMRQIESRLGEARRLRADLEAGLNQINYREQQIAMRERGCESAQGKFDLGRSFLNSKRPNYSSGLAWIEAAAKQTQDKDVSVLAQGFLGMQYLIYPFNAQKNLYWSQKAEKGGLCEMEGEYKSQTIALVSCGMIHFARDSKDRRWRSYMDKATKSNKSGDLYPAWIPTAYLHYSRLLQLSGKCEEANRKMAGVTLIASKEEAEDLLKLFNAFRSRC